MKTISIIILIILACLLFSTPRRVPAEVLSQTKISDTNGLPQELLDYKDRLGVAVANIGDLDGDGTGDIAVGAKNDGDGGSKCGAVYILFMDPVGGVKSYRKISHTTGGFLGSLAAGDYFGFSIAPLGDLDSDGHPDIAVGAPHDNTGASNAGAMWILFLNADGTVKSFQKIAQGGVGGFFGTLTGGDEFGRSAARAGDIDGDSIPDLAIGAPGSAGGTGAVWILFMNTNGTVKTTPPPQQIADGSGGLPTGTLMTGVLFGFSVAGIDDINGDGSPDIAVGSPSSFVGFFPYGSFWIIFLDATGMALATPPPQEIGLGIGGFSGTIDNADFFGGSLGNLGDLDGDSRSDIAVGALLDDDGANDAGAVYIVYPNANGTVKANFVKISATSGGFSGTLQNGDEFGSSIAILGDYDGDTRVEVAIGASFDDDTNGGVDRGAVWIADLNTFENVTSQFIISNTEGNFVPAYLDDGDAFGVSVANLGDLDGNGAVDYAVGANKDGNSGVRRGAVWILFHGMSGAVERAVKINDTEGRFSGGLADNDQFGQSVENIGDLDGDGTTDIAVGAPGDDTNGNLSGAVWIIFLNSDGSVKGQTIISASDMPAFPGFAGGREAGWSIAGLGDIDSDGIPDIAVGAPRNTGEVWVLRLNSDGSVKGSHRIDTSEPALSGLGFDSNDKFGTGLAAADVNGDGVAELAVGSMGDDAGMLLPGAVYILFIASDRVVNSAQKIATGLGGFIGPIGHGDEFGRGVGLLHDIDGNGSCDIVVGEHFDDTGGLNRGSAWVLYMDASGNVIDEEKIADGTGGFSGVLDNDDRLGTSVEGVSCISSGGMLDIALGANHDDDGGTDRGAVWICSYKSIRSSTTNPDVAIPRFLEPNQDTPETHQPDYAPPLQRAPAFGGTNYILHQETFNGAHNWSTVDISGRGDFAAIYSGMTVVQETPFLNATSFWGFFDDPGFTNYACGGLPQQGAVPFMDANGFYLHNEIWSPEIDWTQDVTLTPVPPSASAAYLSFIVYKDLPLDNLVFYYWRVRWLDVSHNPIVTSSSDASGWMTNNFIYYGSSKIWEFRSFPFGSYVPATPAPKYVQAAIGVRDMCDKIGHPSWCGLLGTGVCHSHAPLIDNIEITRIDPPSLWEVNPAHLFQDNFAGDGTLTGTVRMDMAMDLASVGAARPGDTVVVQVTEPVNGLGIDQGNGGAAVYIHVKNIAGGKSGASISADIARWPLVSNMGGWTVLRFDSVYSCGRAVPDRYCIGLNDYLYTPGDTVLYYFSAKDLSGAPSYWNEFTGVGTSQADAIKFAMEATALPANCLNDGGDILYVDAVDGGGADPFYNWAFKLLALEDRVDRYDMRAPSQIVNNGLSTRITNRAAQLNSVYRKIIWDSGDLPVSPVPDGTGLHRSDDFTLLADFIDDVPEPGGGIFLAGDDIPSYWDDSKNAGNTGALSLGAFLSYTMVGGALGADHHDVGEPNNPLLMGEPLSCFDGIPGPDTLIAYGGGTYINAFDVMVPSGSASLEMTYSGNPAHGAVVSQQTVNSQGAAVGLMLAGFSCRFIREDRPDDFLDRSDFLYDVITWLYNAVNYPTGAAHEGLRNKLSQNYPNPFNPRTTISFSIREPGYVRLAVYDVSGRLVRILVNEEKPAGVYNIPWDGITDAGGGAASGVYFYKMTCRSYTKTRKMVLLR